MAAQLDLVRSSLNAKVKRAAIHGRTLQKSRPDPLLGVGDFTARRSRYHPRFHLDGRRA
jgi:hypothetical protein